VYAHFGITHRCNLTCRMCGIWRYGNAAEELSLDQIREVAARMKRLGVVQVAIGGGEPFARSDLEEVARIFVETGLELRVLTNGIGVSIERIDRLLDAGVKNVSISLDSLYPARFDYICEHEGSWDEAVRTITHVGRRLQGVPGALPSINCVASNLNLEELPDLARFAREVGFAISYLPVELLPDAKAGARSWEARFIRYRPEMDAHASDAAGVGARVDRAYDALIGMKRSGWPILNSGPYLEASRSYLKTGRFPVEGCDAGRLYFSVAPNGQFTICHRTVQHHLHFLDPDFEAYWESALYEQKRLLEAGSCEGCMRACWIDTSLMFRTMEGLLQTARLVVLGGERRAMTFEDARAWARRDAASIVPAASAG
jgi:MoaA/NifB/PqqE/SkfB family radical SAM enzyme